MSATSDYAGWLTQGRTHQAANRPIEALQCFRHASALAPSLPEAHFHLGEVMWQLGRSADAIAAWRQAQRVAPRFAGPAQALADALLAVGDWAGAGMAAERVLALAPGDARAQLIAGIAALGMSDGDRDAAARSVLDALSRAPTLLTVPSLAGALAIALDQLADAPAKSDVLRNVAVMSASGAVMPTLLLALLCEEATSKPGPGMPPALAAAAQPGHVAAADHDALRRIAHAAARAQAAQAPALAERYAELCAGAFAPPFPLLWPRRTAGVRLRVVALLESQPAPDARAALAVLAALPRDRFDVAIAVAVAEAKVDGEVGASLPVIALSRIPDAADARRIAALDPDVLIDLAGLSAPTGPLLAQRPARAILTPSDVPVPHVAPLVQPAHAGGQDLGRVLEALRLALPDTSDVPDAADMAALWADAVRTHQQGLLHDAAEKYARVLALQPGYAPAHYLLGVVLRDTADHPAARAQFMASTAAAPRFVDALVAAAQAAQTAGEPAAAAAIAADGLAQAADRLPLYRALGHALLAARDGSGAAQAFAAALSLAPLDADTHFNHGVALQMQRQIDAAAAAYQRALIFEPDLVSAHFNLGTLFQQRGATEAAIATFENVLKAEPTNAAAYASLGDLLHGAARMDAWFANFDRFEANCPDSLALAVQSLEVCQHRGDFARLDRYLDGLRDERYRPQDERELCDDLEQLMYLLLFFDVDPALIFRFAKTYDGVARHVYGTPLALPAVRKPGRLRLGYLSADLRNHVMGKMMWQAIQHHDRSRFELYFYSMASERDEWTARFEGIAHRFATVAQASERDAALRILEDDLDILVDLSTHTKGAMPGILALKPARVILTHVASAGTVGLATVDFKLTDRCADVAENQAYQIEPLLPVENCIYPYRHIAPASTHPFHRSALGVSADTVLIGAFVSPLKLSRRCLALWREVLDRIPRAKLVFSPVNSAFHDAYLRLAAAAGIAAERLLFLPQGRDDAENQARYELIDFVLDPLPFGGANGTLEALDMGVPVVTLVGKRHGERVAYSILANLGATQTVAQSGRDYVELAERLAADEAFMREVREAISSGLAHSPLTDMTAHTRALEDAYRVALAARAPDVVPELRLDDPTRSLRGALP